MSCCYVPSCVPSCSAPATSTVPTCGVPAYFIPSSSASTSFPVGGVGPLTSYGGGSASGGSYGGGSGGGLSGVPASSLGIVAGANVSCVSQTPPSEVLIQPSPIMVTLPGPILSASCEPVRVGGYTACGGGSGGSGRSSSVQSGSGRLGLTGAYRPSVCRRVNVSRVCSSPC